MAAKNILLDSMLTDGRKAVPLNALPPEAWTFITGEGPDAAELKTLYDRVPWLFRGVGVRAVSLPVIPFVILRGEEEIDSSDDYQNTLGWLPDPFTLLEQIELDLVLHSRTILLKDQNIFGRSIGEGLRRLHPPTMKPKTDGERGIVGFIRTINNRQLPLIDIDDVVYIVLPDPWSEIGRARSPAENALSAAGILREVDEFGSAFFQRGAVKVTLLSVSGSVRPEEKEKLEGWWRGVTRGLKDAFAGRVINADRVTPTVIGEGISELSDQGLTKEKREDISTALGIPQSILFSTGAVNRAVSQQDDINFYTKTMIPEAKRIERQLNVQHFESEGVRLQFRPQEMTIFQADEEARSASLLNLVNAGESLENAYSILGFDLPDEVVEDHEEQAKEEENEPEPQNGNINPLFQALAEWQRNSIQRVKAGKAPKEFVTTNIPAEMRSTITGALTDINTETAVRQVFDPFMVKDGDEG